MPNDVLTDSDRATYRALVEACAFVPTDGLSVLEFRGVDALDWLQGQTTQDLRGFAPGQVRATCFLKATGQIQAIATLAAFEGRIVAILPSECFDFVLNRLETTVFMEDVTASKPDVALSILKGPQAESVLKEREWPSECLALAPALGDAWLLWHGPDEPKIDELRRTISQATAVAAEAFRLEQGVPKWGLDVGERTLPPELGPQFEAQHVSYSKGCYLGQEVVMRIRSRGHTNKTWGLLSCEAPVSPGEIVYSDEKAPLGSITSAAVSPEFGPIAAAMLKHDLPLEGLQIQIGDGAAIAERIPFPRLTAAVSR